MFEGCNNMYNINTDINTLFIINKMNNYNIPAMCSHIKIDVGLSYGANQSSNWLDNEPDVMVLGFEPNPEAFNCLMNGNIQLRHPGHARAGDPLNKKHIDTSRIHIFNVALSNVDKMEEMEFYVNANDCGTSSLYSHDQNYLGRIEKVIKVPVYSLKMLFDNFNWEKFEYIDYIKIDAQGVRFKYIKRSW
jgi:FkbM family methyltransferase